MQGLIRTYCHKKDRWDEGHRNDFFFNYPEMTMVIITGDAYPVNL